LTSLIAALAGLPAELRTFLVATLPVIELRGAIPVGLFLGLSPWEAIFWSTLGNLAPIPLLLAGLLAARRWARHWPLVGPILAWIERRVERHRGQVDRYGPWGLALFVGVPLPGTGAWTGAAIAALLDLPLGRATLAIIAGVIIAAALVGLLSTLGWLALT